MEAAGGVDEFLQRYAVVVCSDHGQTHVDRVARLQDWVGDEGLVTASNRAGMVYTDKPRRIAERLAREDAVDIALFMEDGTAVVLRDGGELLLGVDSDGWQGPCAAGRSPTGTPATCWSPRPRASSSPISAAATTRAAARTARYWRATRSVPMLTVGTGEPAGEIAGVAPLVLGHFGIEAPAYARAA